MGGGSEAPGHDDENRGGSALSPLSPEQQYIKLGNMDSKRGFQIPAACSFHSNHFCTQYACTVYPRVHGQFAL